MTDYVDVAINDPVAFSRASTIMGRTGLGVLRIVADDGVPVLAFATPDGTPQVWVAQPEGEDRSEDRWLLALCDYYEAVEEHAQRLRAGVKPH